MNKCEFLSWIDGIRLGLGDTPPNRDLLDRVKSELETVTSLDAVLMQSYGWLIGALEFADAIPPLDIWSRLYEKLITARDEPLITRTPINPSWVDTYRWYNNQPTSSLRTPPPPPPEPRRPELQVSTEDFREPLPDRSQILNEDKNS